MVATRCILPAGLGLERFGSKSLALLDQILSASIFSNSSRLAFMSDSPAQVDPRSTRMQAAGDPKDADVLFVQT